ncbi:hypothetical protein RM780_05125 [Streptomyces sp. DSM 44917]|uniref:4Fe-4S Wbl-type domain-containing protein n=1 Tax=Streptomyces boetiae TaxID=3075541 RepID=A0ABU2L4A2_9ACTN|nr:hypothetical protein [Streptomyces sp. DSM 44917]MDT0306342.1 hypothetical protein [Streptomyces sp. DSM 44917]
MTNPLPPARRLVRCDGCPEYFPEGSVHVCGPPPELAGVDLEARLSLGQWAQEECVLCGVAFDGEEKTRTLGPVFDRMRQPHMVRACADQCRGKA